MRMVASSSSASIRGPSPETGVASTRPRSARPSSKGVEQGKDGWVFRRRRGSLVPKRRRQGFSRWRDGIDAKGPFGPFERQHVIRGGPTIDADVLELTFFVVGDREPSPMLEQKPTGEARALAVAHQIGRRVHGERAAPRGVRAARNRKVRKLRIHGKLAFAEARAEPGARVLRRSMFRHPQPDLARAERCPSQTRFERSARRWCGSLRVRRASPRRLLPGSFLQRPLRES